MQYLTAGESHGIGLTAIIDGFPSGVHIDTGALDAQLRRRQLGYGRGGRMQIESDSAQILSGMFGSVTLGSPIALFIPNRNYEQWKEYTHPVTGDISQKALTAVRPGHADFVGMKKYAHPSAREVLERASARETAARVAIGALCRQLLSALGVHIGSHTVNIGGVAAKTDACSAVGLNERADADPVRCIDSAASQKMIQKIVACMSAGDTAGGISRIIVSGMPAGVGSYVQYNRKLDGILAAQLLSVQAVKSVSFGMGQAVADFLGSQVHDQMFLQGGNVTRKTNNAGGIEGGMSNGEDIVIDVAVKPIPTLMQGLCTVDAVTKEQTTATPERSDYCAVPAAGVVAENVTAYVLCDELLKVTGGDDFATIAKRVKELRARAKL